MDVRPCIFALALSAFAQAAAPVPAPPTARTYRDFALRRDGNAARGRELFLAREKTGCLLCHTIDGSSGKAGPDLSAVGDKLPRRELIEAILQPNATIAIGYEATFIETTSNETFYGVIKESNADAIEFIGPDGVRRRVPRAQVKAQRPSPTSLMPEGIHGAMTVPEFTDLIEFLASLKQPAAALTSNRGMPDDIPVLAVPVKLRPLFDEASRFAHAEVRKPGDVRTGLTWFGQIPGEPDRFLVAHESGTLTLLTRTAEGRFERAPFADFSAEIYSQTGPNGLLGVAFHPHFRENRKYYLKHQVLESGQITTVLVEKVATEDLHHDSGKASRRLLAIPCVTQNHTGGCIQFGPDGLLYLGMGDTGPQQDPNGHGQNAALLLGKMLRIDVNHRDAGLPYAIPADNPFRAQAGVRPEIWAMGLREPWRFSFDPATGDLWVGDVGQDRVEEVDIVRRGENMGWNVYEGFEPFSNRYRRPEQGYTWPVFAYRRKFGASITGGYVYRGDKNSSFYGVYICGDYASKRIWGLTQENRELKAVRQIATCPDGIASFGTDERGSIYVVGYEGMIWQLDLAAANFE